MGQNGGHVLELNRLYNKDCMEGMKEFPDKFFELAIVDPPYGINAPNMSMGSNKSRHGKSKQGENQYPGISTAEKLRKGRLNAGAGKLKNRALNTMSCDWDLQKPSPEYFRELFRVSVNQIIWGGNYFDLPPTRGIICWDKLQPWENFSQWEMAWTSFDRPAAMFRYSNTGGANEEKKIHPTQKPVKLYEWLLTKYAKPGDKILDTHVGSASSLIACYNYGFTYIGFEIDSEYCGKASKRLEAEMNQVRLEITL
jgi:site-specific DNA-methyltransferase (adenine-specific)